MIKRTIVSLATAGLLSVAGFAGAAAADGISVGTPWFGTPGCEPPLTPPSWSTYSFSIG